MFLLAISSFCTCVRGLMSLQFCRSSKSVFTLITRVRIHTIFVHSTYVRQQFAAKEKQIKFKIEIATFCNSQWRSMLSSPLEDERFPAERTVLLGSVHPGSFSRHRLVFRAPLFVIVCSKTGKTRLSSRQSAAGSVHRQDSTCPNPPMPQSAICPRYP